MTRNKVRYKRCILYIGCILEKRVDKGSRAIGSMKKMLKSNEVSRSVKFRIYKNSNKANDSEQLQSMGTKNNVMRIEVDGRGKWRNGDSIEQSIWS